MEGKIMEGKIIEGKIIEGKIMEGKIIEGKIIEGKIMEGKIMRKKRIMGGNVRGMFVRGMGTPLANARARPGERDFDTAYRIEDGKGEDGEDGGWPWGNDKWMEGAEGGWGKCVGFGCWARLRRAGTRFVWKKSRLDRTLPSCGGQRTARPTNQDAGGINLWRMDQGKTRRMEGEAGTWPGGQLVVGSA